MISSADFTRPLPGTEMDWCRSANPGGDPCHGTGRERSNRVGQIQRPLPGRFHCRQRAAIWPFLGSFSWPSSTERFEPGEDPPPSKRPALSTEQRSQA